MSESAAGNPEFTELWTSVSKLCDSKTQDKKTGQQMPGTGTSAMRKGEAADRLKTGTDVFPSTCCRITV